LSILLQGTPENRQLLGEIDGIDILLQQLAVKIFFAHSFV
jgi:beta-catenin-like protein 1